MRCAAGHRRGRASASTCATFRRRSGRYRRRPTRMMILRARGARRAERKPKTALGKISRLPRSHEVESVYVYPDAEGRLNHTDAQHRDVSASFPEPPAQTGDDRSRHEQNQEEAADVIRVSPRVCAGDRSRRKEMPEEANHNEHYTEPNPLLSRHCVSVSGSLGASSRAEKSIR